MNAADMMMSEESSDTSPDMKEDSVSACETLAKKLKVSPDMLREAIIEVLQEEME